VSFSSHLQLLRLLLGLQRCLSGPWALPVTGSALCRAQGHCLAASPAVRAEGQTRDQPSLGFISANNSGGRRLVCTLSSCPVLVGRVSNRCWMLQDDAEFKRIPVPSQEYKCFSPKSPLINWSSNWQIKDGNA